MCCGRVSSDGEGRARCGANGKRSVSLSRSFATFVHVILFVMKTNRNTRGVLLALIGGTGWVFLAHALSIFSLKTSILYGHRRWLWRLPVPL